MNQSFVLLLESDFALCEDCKALPGAFLYQDKSRLAEPTRVCGQCGSRRIASYGGVLNNNPEQIAHVEKEMVSEENLIINQARTGYMCERCEEIFTELPETKTGWQINADAAMLDEDQEWDEIIFLNKEEALRIVQYWQCGNGCQCSIDNLPTVLEPVYECPDCEAWYLEEADARSCCAYMRRRK